MKTFSIDNWQGRDQKNENLFERLEDKHYAEIF